MPKNIINNNCSFKININISYIKWIHVVCKICFLMTQTLGKLYIVHVRTPQTNSFNIIRMRFLKDINFPYKIRLSRYFEVMHDIQKQTKTSYWRFIWTHKSKYRDQIFPYKENKFVNMLHVYKIAYGSIRPLTSVSYNIYHARS